jgi:hypothetical protein
MAWTDAIIRLQDIDLELRDNRRRLAEIQAALQDTSQIQDAERTLAQRTKVADKARKSQEDLEFELERVQTKRARTEQNLYSGRITNARELQDLQAELQSLKRRVSELEDQLLEAMMDREAADEAMASTEADLARLREQTAQATAALTEELESLQATNAALREEKESLRAKLPDAVRESYDYLWDRTGGMPVSQLKGEVCSICGTVVLRPTQRKVQRGQEAYCDSCRRLLVTPS